MARLYPACLLIQEKFLQPPVLIGWLALACDQSCAAIEGEVAEAPADEYDEPVLEAHQVHQMDEQPHEPGHVAAEFQTADFSDGRRPSDHCEVPFVHEMERLNRLTRKSVLNDLCHITALLNSGGRDTRQGISIRAAV